MRFLDLSELVRLVSTDYILESMGNSWKQLASVIKNDPIPTLYYLKENDVIENSFCGNYKIQKSFASEEFQEIVNNVLHYKNLNQPVFNSFEVIKGFTGEGNNYNHEMRFTHDYQREQKNTYHVSAQVMDIMRKLVLNAIVETYLKKESNQWFNKKERFELNERNIYNDGCRYLFWQAIGWIEVRDESIGSFLRRITITGIPEVKVIIFQAEGLNKLEQDVINLGPSAFTEKLKKNAIEAGVLCENLSDIFNSKKY